MHSRISFDKTFWKDYMIWKRQNPKVFERITYMIDLLSDHPAKQRDERVKIWSIDDHNDLIFTHQGEKINLISCRGLDPNE